MRPAFRTAWAVLLALFAAFLPVSRCPGAVGTATHGHAYLSAPGAPYSLAMPAAPYLSSVLRRARLRLVLDMGDDYDLGYDTPWSAGCTVRLEGKDAGGAVVWSRTVQLGTGNAWPSAAHSAPEAAWEADVTAAWPQFASVVGTVLSYSAPPAGVQPFVRLRTQWDVDRGYRVTGAAPATASALACTTGAMHSTFSWTSNTTEMAGWEIEVLKLENTSPYAAAPDPHDITADVDWTRAASYLTEGPQPSATLALAGGTGWYAWRVRAIGDFYPGGYADSRNRGAWSGQSFPSPVTLASSGATAGDLVRFTSFEPDRNWSYGRVFTEGGRVKEQMGYANGLGMQRQAQVVLPSAAATVISQTEYDFSGRAVLGSLPAPVFPAAGATPDLLYKAAALQHNGMVLNASNFDGDANWQAPDPVDGGVVHDHWDGNTTYGSPVPDAGGYPYTRTLYHGDGTSRVQEQAGPGATHRLGAPGDRTTRSYHGMVADVELTRIFGDEAPDASSVLKQLAVDPNGTVSVTYVDKAGQTIATCLSGGAGTENPLLDNLGSRPSTGFPVVHKPKRNELVDDRTIVATVSLAVPEPTDVEVDFSLDPGDVGNACANLCQDCDYHVEIRVQRVDDPTPGACAPCSTALYSHDFPGGACGAAATTMPTVTLNALAPGQYVFTRTVTAMQPDPADAPRDNLESYLSGVRDAILAGADADLQGVYAAIDAGDLAALGAEILLQHQGPLVPGNVYAMDAGCTTVDITWQPCVEENCGTVDFEQMIVDRWNRSGFSAFVDATDPYGLNNGYDWSQPGKTFNDLVARMLAGEAGVAPYDCAELLSCWRGVVEGVEMLEALETPDGFEFDPVGMFLQCAGYRVATDGATTTAWGSSTTGGHHSHPYAFFEWDCGAPPATACTLIPVYGNPCGWASVQPTQDERNAFLACLTEDPQAPNPPSTPAAPTVAEMEDGCRSACEDKFHAYVAEARAYFRSVQQTVSEATVYCTAAQLVNLCKSNCGFELDAQTGELTPGPGLDPACWLMGTASLSPRNGNDECTEGAAPLQTFSGTNGEIVAGWLNARLGDKQDDYGAGPGQWDFGADAVAAGFSFMSGCTTGTVTVFPGEQASFTFTAGGTPGCTLSYTRRGVFIEDPGFQDLDGDPGTVTLSLPAPGAGTQWLDFPGTWSIPPACTTSDAGITVVPGSITVDGCSLQVSTNVPFTLTMAGGVATASQQACPVLCIAQDCNELCGGCAELPPAAADHTVEPVTCAGHILAGISADIRQQLGEHVDTELRRERAEYVQACILAYGDDFSVTHELAYHHYTLYHHDRAGNLVRTTPPHGVDLSSTGRGTHPAHQFETRYWYNSLGQLVRQRSPDGGTVDFWHDAAGRVRFSRDARQSAAGNAYSYTRYDALGRVVEVGESAQDAADPGAHADDQSFPQQCSNQTWTVYTTPAAILNGAGQPQRFLENNVSHVHNAEGVHTFFSYDPHGNVDWMIQRIPGLGDKEIAYEYDLVSGKVLKVKYQEGRPDMFLHRYAYDADNRLTQVETSVDGVVWERDGRYTYMPHGPLGRLLYGEDEVQGLDYVNTVQGWLKAVNHGSLDIAADPAEDGRMNLSGPAGNTARDVWGMQLGYHDGDFAHGGATQYNSTTANAWHLEAPYGGLYNGNISSWTWRWDDWRQPGGIPGGAYGGTRGNTYRYDELNRITAATHHRHAAGAFSAMPGGGLGESFTYDGAGNMLEVSRRSAGTQIDGLGYWYEVLDNTGAQVDVARVLANGNVVYAGAPATELAVGSVDATGNTLSNRLDRVTDAVSPAPGRGDIDTQPAGNYGYDAIGELTGDVAEGLAVEWTPYHKVRRVSPLGTGPVVDFGYGPMQERVSKTETQPNSLPVTTYYVHDASGNVMAIYKREASGNLLPTKLKELPVYGSSRLGLLRRDVTVKMNAACVECGEGGDQGPPPGALRIAEFVYDSPGTDDVEAYLGEYVSLRNTSGMALPLAGLRLACTGRKTPLVLPQGMELPVDGTLIVAFGAPADQAGLLALDDLPAGLAADPLVQWHWQDKFKLPDGAAVLTLEFVDPDNAVHVLERVAYAQAGLAAPNAYCDAACMADTARPPVLAVALEDFGLVLQPDGTYEGQPFEARVANGKGKPGDVYLKRGEVRLRSMAWKDYELTDHLGNVRVVVTDRKHATPANGVYGTFLPDVRVLRDHFAFGMEMTGQAWNSPDYRYGFQGQERDDEVKGTGNSYDFGARLYDPRVGRWWSRDPHEMKYPMSSPYSNIEDNPIAMKDIGGKDGVVSIRMDGDVMVITLRTTIHVIGDVDQIEIAHINNKLQQYKRASEHNLSLQVSGQDVRFELDFSAAGAPEQTGKGQTFNSGDNFMYLSPKVDRGHAFFSDVQLYDVNSNTASGTLVAFPEHEFHYSPAFHLDPTKQFGIGHEVMHLFGIADRYYDFELNGGQLISIIEKEWAYDNMGSPSSPLSNSQSLTGIAEIAIKKYNSGISEFLINEKTGIPNYKVNNLDKRIDTERLFNSGNYETGSNESKN